MSCVSSLLGMAAHHGVRVNFFISSLLGLPNNETTYAELVKEKDYATGYIGNVTLFNSLVFGCYGSNFKGVISEHMSRNKFIRSSVKFLPGERHRTLLMTVQHWFVYWLGAAMVNTTLQGIHGCNSGVEFQLWGICDRETGSHLNMKITYMYIVFLCLCFSGKWHLGLHSSNTKDYLHHPMKQGYDYYYGTPLSNMRDFADDGQWRHISFVNRKWSLVGWAIVFQNISEQFNITKTWYGGYRFM